MIKIKLKSFNTFDRIAILLTISVFFYLGNSANKLMNSFFTFVVNLSAYLVGHQGADYMIGKYLLVFFFVAMLLAFYAFYYPRMNRFKGIPFIVTAVIASLIGYISIGALWKIHMVDLILFTLSVGLAMFFYNRLISKSVNLSMKTTFLAMVVSLTITNFVIACVAYKNLYNRYLTTEGGPSLHSNDTVNFIARPIRNRVNNELHFQSNYDDETIYDLLYAEGKKLGYTKTKAEFAEEFSIAPDYKHQDGAIKLGYAGKVVDSALRAKEKEALLMSAVSEFLFIEIGILIAGGISIFVLRFVNNKK